MKGLDKRSVGSLIAAEAVQMDVIGDMNIKGIDSLSEDMRTVQASRNLSAAHILSENNDYPLQVLNTYKTMTHADLFRSVENEGNLFKANLIFKQFGPIEIKAVGFGNSKKSALHNAAAKLIKNLQ
jgi:hypothetical protein